MSLIYFNVKVDVVNGFKGYMFVFFACYNRSSSRLRFYHTGTWYEAIRKGPLSYSTIPWPIPSGRPIRKDESGRTKQEEWVRKDQPGRMSQEGPIWKDESGRTNLEGWVRKTNQEGWVRQDQPGSRALFLHMTQSLNGNHLHKSQHLVTYHSCSLTALASTQLFRLDHHLVDVFNQCFLKLHIDMSEGNDQKLSRFSKMARAFYSVTNVLLRFYMKFYAFMQCFDLVLFPATLHSAIIMSFPGILVISSLVFS